MSAWKPSVFGRFTSSSSSTLRFQLCMPPQQISPSAASRSPNSSATSHACRNVVRDLLLIAGRIRRPVARARRRVDPDDAVFADAEVVELLRDRQALRTCVTKFLRSSSLPIAEPPPVGGHTGATSDPTTRLRDATWSASRFRSSSDASMLTCGSKRKRSTPSNFTPPTFAAAVRFSIVSRSIGGSESGPLPTSPGHMAL